MSRKIVIRILAFTLCLLFAGGVGVAYAGYQRIKNIQPDMLLDSTNKVEIDPDTGEVISAADQKRDIITYNGEDYSYNEDVVTLMLLGIDLEAGRNSARSDVMVVCAIDVKNHTVRLIVCPRDTQTQVRHTDAEGNATKTTLTKLNHSFPYGNGNNDKNMGAQNVMYNVQQLLSCNGKYKIPMSYYGGLNMAGIGPLTKAVGGVTITLQENVSGVGRKGQTVTLNATTAKQYCTVRKGVGDGSDVSRGKRQMIYLMGLVDQLKTIDPLKAPSLFTQLNKYVFTNLSADDMVAYAKLLTKIDTSNIVPRQLEGSFIRTDASYYVVDEEDMEALIIETFYEKVDADGTTPSSTSELDDDEKESLDLIKPSETPSDEE